MGMGLLQGFGEKLPSVHVLVVQSLVLRFWQVSYLLRCCVTRFASRVSSWRLPLRGNVADLVTEGVRACAHVHGGAGIVARNSNNQGAGHSGGHGRRVRLRRKNPAHLVCQGFLSAQPRSRRRSSTWSGCSGKEEVFASAS